MKSYQQRMETSGIADRIALLAHDHLVQMYEGMGYDMKGKSDVRFAGGGWNNLVRRFDYFQIYPTDLSQTYDFANHEPAS